METTLLTMSAEAEQNTRLTDFFIANSPDILYYASFIFLVGVAIMILSIFVTFGIFKALSYFRELSSF